MTAADPPTVPPMTPDPEHPAAPGVIETVLSGERLFTDATWVQSGRVRLHRRVVTQTRTIDVVVRREELVVESDGLAPVGDGERYRGTVLDGPPVPHTPDGSGEPLVVLLREEVPEVVLGARVYERVTAHVDVVTENSVWHDELRHEEISTDDSTQAS